MVNDGEGKPEERVTTWTIPSGPLLTVAEGPIGGVQIWVLSTNGLNA
jgi:hypothetical protein